MLFGSARIALLFALILCVNSLSFAQAKIRKTETISTAPGKVNAEYTASDGKKHEVLAEVIFTLTEVSTDQSLSGYLTINLPVSSRQRLGELSGTKDLPSSAAVKEVKGNLAPKTHCPEVKIEFKEFDADFAGARLHFDHQALHLVESHQELSRAICIWTERLAKGRNNTSLIPYINLIIKGGDDLDEAPKPKTPESESRPK